jgi:hypothetical protein
MNDISRSAHARQFFKTFSHKSKKKSHIWGAEEENGDGGLETGDWRVETGEWRVGTSAWENKKRQNKLFCSADMSTLGLRLPASGQSGHGRSDETLQIYWQLMCHPGKVLGRSNSVVCAYGFRVEAKKCGR